MKNNFRLLRSDWHRDRLS